MAKSIKARDRDDAARLGRIRDLLSEVDDILLTMENLSPIMRVRIQLGLDIADSYVLEVHEQAHFSATGKLL